MLYSKSDAKRARKGPLPSQRPRVKALLRSILDLALPASRRWLGTVGAHDSLLSLAVELIFSNLNLVFYIVLDFAIAT